MRIAQQNIGHDRDIYSFHNHDGDEGIGPTAQAVDDGQLNLLTIALGVDVRKLLNAGIGAAVVVPIPSQGVGGRTAIGAVLIDVFFKAQRNIRKHGLRIFCDLAGSNQGIDAAAVGS